MLVFASHASAHHSFAPHFDPDSSVTITGKILKFEQRNPHSYIYIEVKDGVGELQEYMCESNGVTQLRRNGIDPDMLRPGSTVTVTGQQHRRDRFKCFFRTVQVNGGPVRNISGAGEPIESPAVSNNDSATRSPGGIFGSWLLIARGAGAGNGESYAEMFDYMTAAGRVAESSYNAIQDDPVYRCHPIGLRRVWYAPGTPTAIEFHDDRVLIRHEWMDVERIVHLETDEIAAPDSNNLFGHSIGRLENGVLTIKTTNYPSGIIRQYFSENNEPPFRGLLHSAELTTTEIIRYDEQSGSLEVTMLFEDPGFYTRSFPPAITRYEATDLKIQPFGCMPE